ncbi:pancreatic triacylglycerol lipase-like isoform X2 [Amphibalanus amphitrite]|uniref:pancreatic triacylglycerol lipase-like isoform X2 n=1 Tax=Amphibalanus amphitrite TaxID=1232801 RepID=UPI001C90908D|nr:pancreatic triacylglycerol lipase-like isoform X2 [Amphibalanus amphitrite]
MMRAAMRAAVLLSVLAVCASAADRPTPPSAFSPSTFSPSTFSPSTFSPSTYSPSVPSTYSPSAPSYPSTPASVPSVPAGSGSIGGFFSGAGGFLPSLIRGIGGSIGGTIGRISQYDWSNLWNNQTANMIMRDDHEKSKCYDDIGCVNYTDAWFHSLYRPVNFFPLERRMIPTRFWVHTRARPDSNLTISTGDDRALERANFSADRDTKFIIHGFLDTGTDDWVREMAQRLLDYGDFNVIAVDWRYGSLPMYQQALSNTQLVAMETAHLIRWLQTAHGLNVSRVHVIGHSLGAQTAGYVGARVPGLGRITGLDPAEPGFQYMAPEVRLDPSDAQFVDVIHSDARSFISSGLGMLQPCGHVDFYPNGGKDQPGCNSYTHTLAAFLEGSLDDFESELLACRHIRAVRIFTDSIVQKPECSFVSHECKDFGDFMKGKCSTCGKNSERCASMGYHADKYIYKNKTLVPFYLTTSSRAPYCLRHYRINIQLGDPDNDQREVKGHLVISMYGPKGRLERYRLPKKDSLTLKHGQTYSFLVQTTVALGPVHRVQLSWDRQRGSLLQMPCLLWCPDTSLAVSHVTLLDMDLPDGDDDAGQTFCPSAAAPVLIKSGQDRVTLYNQTSCVDGRAAAAPPSLRAAHPSRRRPLSAVTPGGDRQRLTFRERTVEPERPRLLRIVRQPTETRGGLLQHILRLVENF